MAKKKLIHIGRSKTELLKGFSLNRKTFKTKPGYVDLQMYFTDEPAKAFGYVDKKSAEIALQSICMHFSGNPGLQLV